jgi:hypothetical protein
MGRKRNPAYSDWTNEQVGCRGWRHWWPAEFAMEWVHVDEYPDGSIKTGHLRMPCQRQCGAKRIDTYTFTPRGKSEYVSSRTDYSEAKNYVLKLNGAPKPSVHEYRAEMFRRQGTP